MQVSQAEIAGHGEVEVSLEVSNTGNRAGKEVVQVYVHDMEATVARPEQELKAFTKVEVQPGETKSVQLRLGREAFWYFDAGRHAWRVEAGEFEIRAGRSSRDLPLRSHITVAASEDQPVRAETQRGADG